MRRECASPILGPVWWQETQCPLIWEGSCPSSKIMRWQCIQLSLDRDRAWGVDAARNILQHLAVAFDQTRKATVSLCISAGLMKAKLTTLSSSLSPKGYSLYCSSSSRWFLNTLDTVPLHSCYVKSLSFSKFNCLTKNCCSVKSICHHLGRGDTTFCLTWHSVAKCQKCHVNRLI